MPAPQMTSRCNKRDQDPTCVAPPSVNVASRDSEVVLVRCETAATLRPASALVRLDLPALGAPTMPTCSSRRLDAATAVPPASSTAPPPAAKMRHSAIGTWQGAGCPQFKRTLSIVDVFLKLYQVKSVCGCSLQTCSDVACEVPGKWGDMRSSCWRTDTALCWSSESGLPS